jgi:hypothetical protein
MINRKTVLILGAGASHPYGLPLGKALRHQLAYLKVGESPGYVPLLDSIFGAKEVREFSEAFRRASMSIDEFLGNGGAKYEAVGKAAIVAVICSEELESLLHNMDGRRQDEKLYGTGHWYDHLWERMREGVANPGMLEHNKLSIITFNYDRSLECFLHLAVREGYGVADIDAANFLRWLDPIHIYGSVGKFHPSITGVRDGIYFRQYSPELTADDLREGSKSIRVISESRDVTPELEAARACLSAADQIVFLGFGFDQTNMRRLAIPSLFADKFHANAARPSIRFTSLGLFDTEADRIKRDFGHFVFPDTQYFNGNCQDALRYIGSLMP